jgi:hypothetical protein
MLEREMSGRTTEESQLRLRKEGILLVSSQK